MQLTQVKVCTKSPRPASQDLDRAGTSMRVCRKAAESSGRGWSDSEGGTPPSGDTASEVRRAEPDAKSKVPTRTAQGGIDSYNERQVAKRAEATVEELLKEFKTNRAATIASVEAADEELFGREIRSAGGITGVLADVIYAVAVQHVRGHVNDIIGTE